MKKCPFDLSRECMKDDCTAWEGEYTAGCDTPNFGTPPCSGENRAEEGCSGCKLARAPHCKRLNGVGS